MWSTTVGLFGNSATSLLQTTGIFVALTTLLVLFYLVFLHPLAKYPGPLLAKCTDLWVVYHGSKGDLAQTLEALHRKHGEVVRFGPNRISFNTIEALENVYGYKANTRKSNWYYFFAIDPVRPSTHTAIDRVQHARKRRLISQGLSTKATKELEEHVLECINVLSNQLLSSDSEAEDGWGEAKDIADWLSFFTIDVMGAMVFSKRFGLMESSENRWLKDAVPLAARGKYAYCFMPWLNRTGLHRALWPHLTHIQLRLRDFSISQLKQRFARKDDESLTDLFHFILKAKDPETGESFGVQELGSEANLLVAAGGDTTSTAMTATLFYLTKYEEILQKASKEVRGKFKSLEEIRPGSELSSCTYLRACTDEAMRLSPPVPSPLLREALAGGVTINGRLFPRGTDLAVPAFAIHRNPTYFPDPLAYRPERWLGKEDKQQELARAAFCPFSIGSRGCVGRSVGYLELTTALARILWAMDLRREPGSTLGESLDGTYKMIDGFVVEKHGPRIQFRPRRDKI